jgi:protein-tyrosine phosphatase
VSADANQIVPGLWMGQAPPPAANLPGFTMVVLTAKEYQPKSAQLNLPGVQVVHVPLPDGPLTQQLQQAALNAAVLVANEVKAGGKVLVTCWAGANRSGLVVALALEQMGMAGPIALAKVRAQRFPNSGHVPLSNPYFVQMILQ